jgi:hypothetical protein
MDEVKLSIIGEEEIESNEKGKFSFSYLKLGKYRILANKSGYIPQVKSVKIDSSNNRKIDIAMKSGNTDLFGIIMDKSNHLLSGVEVTIKNSVRSVKSDSNGLYQFEKLNSGTNEIIFSKKGYFTDSKRVLVAVGLQTRLDSKLRAGEDNQAPMPLKLSPFAFSPNNPEMLGYPSKSIYLIFDEPVGRSALNILNYKMNTYMGDSVTGLIKKLDNDDVMLTGVSFHRGDQTFKTIKFNVSYSQKVEKMPFIELFVKGVSDKSGNVIPEAGSEVKNFSTGYYKMELLDDDIQNEENIDIEDSNDIDIDLEDDGVEN